MGFNCPRSIKVLAELKSHTNLIGYVAVRFIAAFQVQPGLENKHSSAQLHDVGRIKGNSIGIGRPEGAIILSLKGVLDCIILINSQLNASQRCSVEAS